jgi:hypothetical protein
VSRLGADSNAFDVAWCLAVVGVGSGLFQSPNNSAVMGSVPVPYLGIASGILAAMRNVGMVLGIAVAGAVLYNSASVSVSLGSGSSDSTEIAAFLRGLHWAYITGAGIAAAAAATSLKAVAPRKDMKDLPPHAR